MLYLCMFYIIYIGKRRYNMGLILNMLLGDNIEDLQKKKAELEKELEKVNEAIKVLSK